jgi:hypothetical protein
LLLFPPLEPTDSFRFWANDLSARSRSNRSTSKLLSLFGSCC